MLALCSAPWNDFRSLLDEQFEQLTWSEMSASLQNISDFAIRPAHCRWNIMDWRLCGIV